MVIFDLSDFVCLRFGGGWQPRLRAILFPFLAWAWVLGLRGEVLAEAWASCPWDLDSFFGEPVEI